MKLLVAALLAFSATAFAGDIDGRLCAVVFNTQSRHETSSLKLMDGDAIANLNTVPLNNEAGDWDNRISRVVVKNGCTMIGYQYQDFGVNYRNGRHIGWSVTLENTGAQPNHEVFMPDWQNNAISSLKCFCL